ncbi:unnamed protein product [Amoebophrya sp. A120]|nr:unnamed protein product [Amoebophrya sp. A120]|eukprot:GSA120T00024299001.1
MNTQNPSNSGTSSCSEVFIDRCIDRVNVMNSKVKPKKVTIKGSDGNLYPFLGKMEQRGDLKKDKRVMELCNLLNKLLRRNGESMQRKLDILIKNFSKPRHICNVYTLTENHGLLEWVQNTVPMRNCIEQEHMHCKHNLLDPDTFAIHNMDYLTKLVPRHPPVLHLWYQRTSADPSDWLARRNTYAKSLAVWSMLGYILGLGDRHGENILIDKVSGSIVHVDFDCLFGRGLHLAKPEVVPFRLTANCVTPLGVTGVEGLYRHSCEVFMKVIQNNRDTLSAVLGSFVADPFVDWKNKV